MKYRILKTTDKAGRSLYYVQKKIMLFFWTKVLKEVGMNFWMYEVHDSEDEAKNWIDTQIKIQKIRKSYKVIKEETIEIK